MPARRNAIQKQPSILKLQSRSSELARLQKDMVGLERLHALQLTLMQEIRRQIEDLVTAEELKGFLE
ncbi:hypothetical protein SH661x_000012 [Planctomicrobium sp. SH661]|uniref:hypothetical protein n=1 Tax=Planctomicrobium sp. SH661 TaxID=3448124 RepID=UPI003F5C50CD